MDRYSFFILDVFAENKYSGNQLAVFLNGSGFSDAQMQKIAKEINFSETTFIISENPKDSIYDVRIFTPEHEVLFAGHPTLGTAYVINNKLQNGCLDKITLNVKAGKIPVFCDKDANGGTTYWMKQIEPRFGDQLTADIIAPVLGLSIEEIDSRFPIEEVSTGLPHIIVPLKNLETLKKIKVSKELYFNLINNTWAKNILVFSPEPHNAENDISTRMFADYLGIPEDPATGSGNGCLGGYFIRHQYFGKDNIKLRCEQGYEIGRPSLLHLKAQQNNGNIDIMVGGNVVLIAGGDLI